MQRGQPSGRPAADGVSGPNAAADQQATGDAHASVDSQAAVDADAGALAGKRVLIAEDNAVNMIIASTLLREWQIDVVEAVDGQAAVDAVDASMADQRPFDLILMDVQMPKLDGFAATRILRACRDYLPVLPIVALTAGALPAEREAALASGMDAFLTKPIDEAVL